ncbi:MAG: FAD-dependent oxidoreductase [Chloroflexi bacterium]|nr:FAD-dependent oxidoreductase [Chloroflexota bacterium]
MKVIIVGGVAGGASCAARLRRLDESAEIIVVERGPHISYANCGLPYYVGGLIPRESKLVLADAALFRAQLNVEVRTLCEAVAIDPAAKTVQLRDVATGEVTTESYDKLVLSPGATPIRPPLPGIDLPGVFVVRTVPDVHAIREWMEGHVADPSGLDTYTGYQTVLPAKRAVVVGGGFIGLEMAENLVHLGLDVTLVQRGPQLMSPMDPEMARYVERHVARNGVKLALGENVTGFRPGADSTLEVLTASGREIPADIVVMGIGVRPELGLAKTAGLAIGERGGILVDDRMRTSVPDIFAVGDAIEVRDHVTGAQAHVPLAGPANRQGRIAAEVIAGRDSRFRGTQGTAIIGVFGGAAAWTGASEKTLRRIGDTDYEKVYIYPNSHAGYYPGAQYLAIKILFRKSDGRLLGAQAVGLDGVDKRIDAFAMALQLGATVYDLEEAELTYAPQFGSAKSPVNFAGMVAADVLRDDMPVVHWGDEHPFLLDVRQPAELAVEQVPGVVNIPLPELRARLDELPHDREIHVICRSGQRAYYATRILLQNGFDARNISGGMLSHATLGVG